MAAQTFMLIECPNCFALMRGRAKFCRRCGQELTTAVIAAEKPTPTLPDGKKNMRLVRVFCAVGLVLLIWGIADGSVDRGILGGFLLIIGAAGYCQWGTAHLKLRVGEAKAAQKAANPKTSDSPFEGDET
jgi:hypothetical protein